MNEPTVVIKAFSGPVESSSTMSWPWCDLHHGWHLEPACELPPDLRVVRDMVKRHINEMKDVYEALA